MILIDRRFLIDFHFLENVKKCDLPVSQIFLKKFLWLQFLNYLNIEISDLQKIYRQGESGKRKLNDFSFVYF